jgi:hypothetical protein
VGVGKVDLWIGWAYYWATRARNAIVCLARRLLVCRGRHHVKMDSRGRCYRCNALVRAGES